MDHPSNNASRPSIDKWVTQEADALAILRLEMNSHAPDTIRKQSLKPSPGTCITDTKPTDRQMRGPFKSGPRFFWDAELTPPTAHQGAVKSINLHDL